jgi:UDP-glucuronate 4-epimerase
MQRDFTYIDDIVEGVIRVMDKPATPNSEWDSAAPDPGTSSAPYRIFNIGNNNPVLLMDFIGAIENALGKTAEKELLPMQPGDVAATYADIDALVDAVDYHPATPVQVGIDRFIDWYMEHMHN